LGNNGYHPLETNEVLDSFRGGQDREQQVHDSSYVYGQRSKHHSRNASHIDELIQEEMKLQEMKQSTTRSEANVIDDEETNEESKIDQEKRKNLVKNLFDEFQTNQQRR